MKVAATGSSCSIAVSRAPEPGEIYWENFAIGNCNRTCRRILIIVPYLLMLCLSAAIITGVERLKLSYIQNHPDDTTFVLVVTILGSSMVAVLNICLNYVILYTTHFEMLKTKTMFIISELWKRVPTYLINNILIWFAIFGDEWSHWYQPGNLLESGFYLALSNLFLPNLLLVTNFLPFMYRKFCEPWVDTQSELNRLYEPPVMDMAEGYASLLRTAAIGLFFGPGLPIMYPITAVALIIMYWSWKYALVRCFRRPPAFSDEIAPFVRKWALGMCLGQSVAGSLLSLSLSLSLLLL